MTIPCGRVNGSTGEFSQRYTTLLALCFGHAPAFWLERIKASGWNKLHIHCRPDQFARFIILRNNAGISNGIQELNADYFDAAKERRANFISVVDTV